MPGRFRDARLVQTLIEYFPFGIVLLNRSEEIVLWNDSFGKHLSRRPKTGLGVSFLHTLTALETRLPAGRFADWCDFDLRKVLHRQRYLQLYGRRIPEGFMIVSIDNTAEVEKAQHTVNAMVDWQEQERRRLSEEIHDGIGPLLSALKLSLEGMAAQIRQPNQDFSNNYNNALDLLQSATTELRGVSHALMPAALIDFGLVAALESLCAKANESGRVQVNFYHSGIEQRLEPSLERGLYRMAQELLNNAFKHAAASSINVQLIGHPNSIVLMVEDDGAGFAKEKLQAPTQRGIGLRNIQMRTRSLGGSFTMESHPGAGVLATVELPVI